MMLAIFAFEMFILLCAATSLLVFAFQHDHDPNLLTLGIYFMLNALYMKKVRTEKP